MEFPEGLCALELHASGGFGSRLRPGMHLEREVPKHEPHVTAFGAGEDFVKKLRRLAAVGELEVRELDDGDGGVFGPGAGEFALRQSGLDRQVSFPLFFLGIGARVDPGESSSVGRLDGPLTSMAVRYASEHNAQTEAMRESVTRRPVLEARGCSHRQMR